MDKRRLRERDRMARDMVASNVLVWFERDGRLIEAVPTLDEARGVADSILQLLDVANGDVTSDTLPKEAANALLAAVASVAEDSTPRRRSKKGKRH